MRKIFLPFFILSVVIVLLLNLTYGTYFENYEPILNSLTVGEYTSPFDFSFFVSTWFYIFPFFSLFNKLFHSPHGYSWINTILNTLVLSTLMSSVYMLLGRSRGKFMIVLVTFLMFACIYIENIVLVQNLRTSFFCLFAAYLIVYLIRQSVISRSGYILAVSLAIVGTLARLEIGVLTSVILLFFSIVFQRQMLWFSGLLLLGALSVFVFYKTFQHTTYPDYQTLLDIEHAYEDRQAVVPAEAKDYKEQLLLRAIGDYLRDDEVFSMRDCARIIYHQTFTEYIHSEKFAKIYWSKLKQLAFLMREYVWLLILTLILCVYTAVIYLRRQSHYIAASMRILSLPIFAFGMILTLSVTINCPLNFVVSLCTSACLLCLIYLTRRIDGQYSIRLFCIAFLLLFQLPLTGYHLHHQHQYQSDIGYRAYQLRAFMADMSGQGRTIVFSQNVNETYYPSRLFSGLYAEKVDHYYCDFFLSRYPFFYSHNEIFFGEGYATMRGKMQLIADHDNVIFISNDLHNNFLAEYMLAFHDIKLTFTELPSTMMTNDLRAYKVTSSISGP